MAVSTEVRQEIYPRTHPLGTLPSREPMHPTAEAVKSAEKTAISAAHLNSLVSINESLRSAGRNDVEVVLLLKPNAEDLIRASRNSGIAPTHGVVFEFRKRKDF